MSRAKPHLFVAVAILLSVLPYAAAAQTRLYSLTEIPRGEFAIISGGRINEAGQVAGRRSMPQPERPDNGFVWSAASGLIDIGIGPAAFSINNDGIAVGTRFHPDEGHDAFIWTAESGVRLLSSFPGGEPFATASGTTAIDINNLGQVTGHIFDGYSYLRDPDGTFRRLPVPHNSSPTSGPNADSLNDRGDVVGRVGFADGTYRAFLWPAAGGYRDLGDLPGGLEQGVAVGINNRGQIVGDGLEAPDPAFPASAGQRAVLFLNDGTIRRLGLLPGMSDSSASDINEPGDIIGRSWNAGLPGSERAVLWSGEFGPLDLNTVLDESGRGWTLNLANSINDRGQIVVGGMFEGSYRYAVITPVPEPAGLSVLGLGVLAMRRRRGANALRNTGAK